jgi:amino acid transporter
METVSSPLLDVRRNNESSTFSVFKSRFMSFPVSHEHHSPLNFTAEDRRRHHREALFFSDCERSEKTRITRGDPGLLLPIYQQLEIPTKPLSLWGMVAIIFFAVSGGPFGSEEAVSKVGPLWVLIGFVVLPLVWSLPEALMTAELTTMFPGNGGYVFWTTAAFGNRIGFLQGCWSWLSNVTSIAVYPHLLLEYLRTEFPVLEQPFNGLLFLTTFTISMSYINYRGLHIIGSGGAIAIFLVLAPFGLLALLGFTQIEWQALGVRTPISAISPIEFVTFLNIMFWNLNSWENCSVLSGEISNPQRTLPKAIFLALIITVLGYLVPLVVAIGVMSGVADYSSWSAGYFQAVGYHVGGRPMALLILMAACFGCVGQYQSILCSTAYSFQSLGEIGMLPAFTAGRSRYDTPTVGIVLSTLIVLCLSTFGFVDIVQLLNCIYCLALLVEFATLIKLRQTHENMARPFRIPLGTVGLIMMVIPAVATVVGLILVPPLYGDYLTTYYLIGGVILSIAMLLIVETGRIRNWLEFSDRPPETARDVIERLRIF